jgi:ubiquinone biosynthesis protein Coq4
MEAEPTLREALEAFRLANGLVADEPAQRWRTFQVGPVHVPLPNFAWRRRAITAHDLHHLLTGYPCNLRGEFQIAAWEFGAGPMPHWGAALSCFPLVVIGFFWSPRRIVRAFRAGRRSRSLHGLSSLDAVLAMPLSAARAAIIG